VLKGAACRYRESSRIIAAPFSGDHRGGGIGISRGAVRAGRQRGAEIGVGLQRLRRHRSRNIACCTTTCREVETVC